MSDCDDDEPTLSDEALAALNVFYAERELESSSNSKISENWQLSQFWYDEATTAFLAKQAFRVAGPNGKIALISCPTLFPAIKSLATISNRVLLFEYDERFSVYGNNFIPFNYEYPLDVPQNFWEFFDVVVVDPPFLSEECLTKTAKTVKFLTRKNIILCTGGVMESLAMKLLSVKRSTFKPTHKNNLANEFFCYTNFEIESSCNM